MTRVLAVASGGGHWAQLQLLVPAFETCDLIFASPQLADAQVRPLTDCNLGQPLRVLRCAGQVASLIMRSRPDVVVSTGAAPGALAIVIGKLFGARTIWVDSVANVRRISLSGRAVRRFSDLWLTQWPDLASTTGARFSGRVL